MDRKVAQYVRASSNNQPLSIDEQQTAIAKFAHEHRMQIVRTYADDARTGLTLRGRDAMQQLLCDVMKRDCAFDAILVLDVSRWGRFQDLDESAYYEYHCRKHGVAVLYVADPAPVPQTPFDSILKQLRRASAAEYSRELGRKARAGQVHVVNLGFAVGRMPCIGYRREAVSMDGGRAKQLESWERKPVPNDRIRWVLGPEKEVRAVQSIFRDFAAGKSQLGIAARMKKEGMTSHQGTAITVGMVNNLLSSEVVTGRFSWGLRRGERRARTDIARLDQPACNEMVPRIVDERLWLRAQAKLQEACALYHPAYSDAELLRLLREALQKAPNLTTDQFEQFGLPRARTYRSHFGDLRRAFEAIGESPDNREGLRIEHLVRSRRLTARFVRDLADRVRQQLPGAVADCLTNELVLEHVRIRVSLAPQQSGGKHEVRWVTRSLNSKRPRARWWLIMRMNSGNETGKDFYVLPPHVSGRFNGYFSRDTTRRLEHFRESCVDDVIAAITFIDVLCAAR